MKKQSGFTLVEIAIVLVIIGLLLGGVLKGQELINSAKVKSIVNDFRTVSSFVYSYQDRFRVFPGDQTQAQLDNAFRTGTASVCTPPATATCAPNNARIDGNWYDGTVASETYVFWQHVRLANFATGTTDITASEFRHRNADGGLIGIESGLAPAGGPDPYIGGMTGAFYVCTDGVLGRYVRQIDTAMDDGNTAGGNVRATPSAATPPTTRPQTAVVTTDIQDGALYIVCAGF